MKLEDIVEAIRTLILKAFDKRLSQVGLLNNKQFDADKIPTEAQDDRRRMDDILNNLKGETGGYTQAREKLIDELSFTLFNRIAGVKVMEAHQLFPEVITRSEFHGGRSFGHKLWLEQDPPERASLKLEGLREYIRDAFTGLSESIQLYSPEYLYDMLPDVFDLNAIIEEFNKIGLKEWQSDDIMGWMYEYYNRKKRESFKASKQKIEYQWVPLTSQVYTPRWVVEFILNNSLGKLWMEMHPESSLKERHDIANAPAEPTLKALPVEEIKVLDPAMGSGNFLLYAFDLLYEMYQGQGYEEAEIPHLIIENNLYGIDIDDRAVQIAQLGLYIKALKRNRNAKISRMNVVSADFYLPEYDDVKDFFQELTQHPDEENLMMDAENLLKAIWNDLRMAYKFGSLIQIEESIQSTAAQHGSKKQQELWGVTDWKTWKLKALEKIKQAIMTYSQKGNGKVRFLKTKALDSISFIEILLNKFDIVVANPPYTDSGDYGKEIKKFIDEHYRNPIPFNSNLYSTFMKRASELVTQNGKIGFIHPPTFMYIKTFESMRKYILDNYYIHIFVEWGYLGIFSPTARVDSAIYILERKGISIKPTIFIKLNEYYEAKRKDVLLDAFRKYLNGKIHKDLYLINQDNLRSIKSYPFIYWISDEFREKFKEQPIETIVKVAQGLFTSNNSKFLRYWWEINKSDISVDYLKDRKKWVRYTKGGYYVKWFGNLWLVVNWANWGEEIKSCKDENGKLLSRPQNEKYYFREGITFSTTSSKGASFRKLPKNFIFDGKGSSIFIPKESNLYYILALMNSSITRYIIKCLNSTVETTIGDLRRIPFVYPLVELENRIIPLSQENVEIKKHLCDFSIIEINYTNNPLVWAKKTNSFYSLKELIKIYLDYENNLMAQIFLNEAIIDELIFEVYQLSKNDKEMILENERVTIGSLPVLNGYQSVSGEQSFVLKEHIYQLDIKSLGENERLKLIKEIEDLYGRSHSLEEICETTLTNPLSIAQILKESTVLPRKKMNDIAKNYLFDIAREILEESDDGIIPLMDIGRETALQNRVYEKLIRKGFTSTQIANYCEILGRDINPYLENYFFKELSDRLNLFQNLPKTPFIWHLSSGEHNGFEAFILIYKWSRDKMLRLKSVYIEKRESSLKNRLIDLAQDNSIKAQEEKDKLQRQLAEIKDFKTAIDDILESGYDPQLDDGVGKNIAPLQKRGLLTADVLTENELEKYLNADW